MTEQDKKDIDEYKSEITKLLLTNDCNISSEVNDIERKIRAAMILHDYELANYYGALLDWLKTIERNLLSICYN